MGQLNILFGTGWKNELIRLFISPDFSNNGSRCPRLFGVMRGLVLSSGVLIKVMVVPSLRVAGASPTQLDISSCPLQHNTSFHQHTILYLLIQYQLASFITTTLASIHTSTIMAPRTPRQVSEASNPEEVVEIALQNRDPSAALQAKVVDAQMRPNEVQYNDDPLLPAGLFPLADPNVYANSENTTRYPTTPEDRRGPNTGFQYSVPAGKARIIDQFSSANIFF